MSADPSHSFGANTKKSEAAQPPKPRPSASPVPPPTPAPTPKPDAPNPAAPPLRNIKSVTVVGLTGSQEDHEAKKGGVRIEVAGIALVMPDDFGRHRSHQYPARLRPIELTEADWDKGRLVVSSSKTDGWGCQELKIRYTLADGTVKKFAPLGPFFVEKGHTFSKRLKELDPIGPR